MIQAEKQSIDEQRLKLEQELDQYASNLVHLRTSYAELKPKVESYRATCKDTFQQYMTLTNDWSLAKKQTNESKIRVQMTKNQIKYFKNFYSYELNKCDLFSMDMSDFAKFWKLEWEQIVEKIRHDFKLLYEAIRQETISFYEEKSKEVQIELEQITQYQQVKQEKYIKIQQKLQSEYEEVQKKLTYEKEILLKSEAIYFKLESELKTIQIQDEERFEAQSNDLYGLQESIVAMVSSVEEIRRRKVYLESEIIIYRHLLIKCGIVKQIEMPSSSVVSITKKRKFIIESQCRGSINIECPLDSTYIRLMNQSASAVIDISRWLLKRRVDSKMVLQYTLPNGLRLLPGSELRVYSKLGGAVAQKSSDQSAFSSSLHQQIILNDVFSMGIGDKIETQLLDEKGEEKASCIQSATNDWIVCD
ncbi:unnamed protein product [Rotaria sordida]|uniref:LTD domain-containing protein n=1 Tax=Rotaria sordida TaxID=392033 RepID=A0A814ZLT5_9BILA|nr:unnamed protein product [Rotaria sordida]